MLCVVLCTTQSVSPSLVLDLDVGQGTADCGSHRLPTIIPGRMHCHLEKLLRQNALDRHLTDFNEILIVKPVQELKCDGKCVTC